MTIRIGYDIVVEVKSPTPMVCMLHTRPELGPLLTRPDDLHTEPNTPVSEYIDGFGNKCSRVVAMPGQLRLYTDALLQSDGKPDEVVPDAPQVPIEELPSSALEFLLASRYCEVDRLSRLAWDKFGSTKPGWERVQAVVEFAHKHITFGYNFASSTKTAYDVLGEGKGVCRDYQHLAVTLCRALGIPARYATGYLGEIRVENPAPGAMDFSAWFEAYLGGRWYAFDARHNHPRVGRTLMAVGRDAADVALITSFGPHNLVKFDVICEEVTEQA